LIEPDEPNPPDELLLDGTEYCTELLLGILLCILFPEELLLITGF
jgi:hypothetical protein